jgi:hypothetical protein
MRKKEGAEVMRLHAIGRFVPSGLSPRISRRRAEA